MTNSPVLVSESYHESTFKLIRYHNFKMLYFQSGQFGHSTNTIILKSNEHKSYAWVFCVICTFQSSQFFDAFLRSRSFSSFGTDHRWSPSWNRITDRTHAPPFWKRGGWTPLEYSVRAFGSTLINDLHNFIIDWFKMYIF